MCWRRGLVRTVLATIGLWFVLTGCASGQGWADIWDDLPQPEDVRLNGSVQQIAMALSESVELPSGHTWSWQEAEEDWDADHPLVVLSHGLPLHPNGDPQKGELPPEVIEAIEEWMTIASFDRYAVQFNRIVLLGLGPFSTKKGRCETVAILSDVRLVTGGDREETRWEVRQATRLKACPVD